MQMLFNLVHKTDSGTLLVRQLRFGIAESNSDILITKAKTKMTG